MPTSEDCLTLNIWSKPAIKSAQAKKPVYVFFHGGRRLSVVFLFPSVHLSYLNRLRRWLYQHALRQWPIPRKQRGHRRRFSQLPPQCLWLPWCPRCRHQPRIAGPTPRGGMAPEERRSIRRRCEKNRRRWPIFWRCSRGLVVLCVQGEPYRPRSHVHIRQRVQLPHEHTRKATIQLVRHRKSSRLWLINPHTILHAPSTLGSPLKSRNQDRPQPRWQSSPVNTAFLPGR